MPAYKKVPPLTLQTRRLYWFTHILPVPLWNTRICMMVAGGMGWRKGSLYNTDQNSSFGRGWGDWSVCGVRASVGAWINQERVQPVVRVKTSIRSQGSCLIFEASYSRMSSPCQDLGLTGIPCSERQWKVRRVGLVSSKSLPLFDPQLLHLNHRGISFNLQGSI